MADAQLEQQFLEAAAELVLRQGELLPRVERALGVDPYAYWIACSHGPPKESDPETDGEWRWTFHGLDVDIAHERDGRFVRVDLGPRGRRDVFSDYGVGLFVCHTRAPWREFPELRAALAGRDGEPKFEVYAALGTALLSRGDFDHADPELAALAQRYTTTDPGGYSVLAPPEDLQADPLDLALCTRLVLSSSGRRRPAGGP